MDLEGHNLHLGEVTQNLIRSIELYLDFAARALNAEKERIERIRDALEKETSRQAATSETCSEGDGQCSTPPEDATNKNDKYSSVFGHFLTHDLKPGEA